MAVLNINWGALEKLAPATAAVTGEEEVDQDRTAPRLDKPLMIYVVAPGDARAEQKIDRVALDPDNVRIGSQFFRCVKVTPENAAKDRILAENGKADPRFIFVTPDYEVAAVVEGKISGKKLFTAMTKAAKKSYDCNFPKNVKALRSILNEFDKIENEREVLEQKEGRGVNAAGARKIAKERAELDERHEKAMAEKKELLEVPTRDPS